MTLNIILNVIFIVVMAVGIVFVWRLQKTLNGLHKNRMDMEKFLSDFSGNITRAQKAIRDLQDTARDVGEDVEGHLAKAQGLRDELSFLVEAADKVASRLSDSASAAQSDAKQARLQRNEKSPEKAVDTKAAEKPLSAVHDIQKQKTEPVTQQVKKVDAAPTQDVSQGKTVPTWVKRAEQNAPIINAPVEEAAPVSGLQFGARKASKAAETQPAPVEKEEAKEQPRSLAERELLQALEKMK